MATVIENYLYSRFCMYCLFSLQLIVKPKSMEKSIKLQLPITIATYPFGRSSQNDDNFSWPERVLRPETHQYPLTLPVFRPSATMQHNREA